MRKVTRSWAFRIGGLVLAGIVLYGTAYLLMPRTADGVSVTVRQCATIQGEVAYECTGTTIFRKSYTDHATVSAVRATLEEMDYKLPLDIVVCQAGWHQSGIYTVDLLWHGLVVKSYVAPISSGGYCFWSVRTLGIEQLATDYGTTTWQDLLRLTGMPDVSLGPLGHTAVP